MPYATLVYPGVLTLLQAARARYGDIIIERVPTAQEVSDFLGELQSHSPLRVSERLHFSERDGTVAFTHFVDNPPTAIRDEFPTREVMLRLYTVTQDYTDRSKDPWDPTFGWNEQSCHNVMHGECVPVVNALLDRAQKFLLQYGGRPRYLHIVRRDLLSEGGRDFVRYTVEVACRKDSEGDVNMPSLSALVHSWPFQHHYARRRAHPDEVTLWAVLNIVPPEKRLDAARRNVIRDAINALAPFCEPRPASLTPAPRKLHPGNTYQLLRVRHSAYQDGRARYAIVRSAVKSREIAPHANAQRPITPSTADATATTYSAPLRTTRNNCTKIITIVLATLLTGALGLIYLVRLRNVEDDGIDEVVGVAVGIAFGIMMPSAAVWIWLCYGCQPQHDFGERKVTRSAEELYEDTKNGSVYERLEAAMCEVSLRYYNDNRLTFTALKYTGSVNYPGHFFVSELIAAGYQTTFALDGREVLVTPKRAWVRLLALDDNGGAVFGSNGEVPERRILSVTAPPIKEEEFGRRVVPDTTGDWAADLEIGNKANIDTSLV